MPCTGCEMKLSNLVLLSLCSTCLISSAYSTEIYKNPAIFGVDLTGGLFRGSANDSGFAIAESERASAATPSGSLLKVDPKGEFGGAIAINYQFAHSPNKVGIYYGRIDTESSKASSGLFGPTKIPSDWGVDEAAEVRSNIDFDVDIFRFTFGQIFQGGCHSTIMPQLGFAYLRVQNDQTTIYSGEDVDPLGSIISIEEKSSFKGFGPAFAIDIDYKIHSGFSIFGNFVYAGLIGDTKASYTALSEDTDDTSTSVEIETKKLIVSLLQTEMGLAYLFDSPNYAIKFMLGYSVASSLGSESKGDFVDDVNESKFITSIKNVGFQGPFARLAFNFQPPAHLAHLLNS